VNRSLRRGDWARRGSIDALEPRRCQPAKRPLANSRQYTGYRSMARVSHLQLGACYASRESVVGRAILMHHRGWRRLTSRLTSRRSAAGSAFRRVLALASVDVSRVGERADAGLTKAALIRDAQTLEALAEA